MEVAVTRRSFLRGAFTVAVGLMGVSSPPPYDRWVVGDEGPFLASWPWSVNLRTEALLAVPDFTVLLDLAHRLGVTLVRFDAGWKHLQVAEDRWDSGCLARFAAIVHAANAQGMRVIANLDDYPAWALKLLATDRRRFERLWGDYVRKTALALGPGVAFYQLGNEFNSVLDPIPAPYDPRVVVLARGALRDAGWKGQTVINPFFGFHHLGSEWDPALRRMLEAAAEAIDVIALDYYPGSYNPWGDPRDWRPLASLARYAKEYDKRLAIGEMGYPTFLGGQQRQVVWLQTTLTALAEEVRELGLRNGLAFVNLFELCDREHLAIWELWRPTEVTLGLADHTLKPKPGFYALQRMIAEFRRSER